jgi:hypothetical protein
MDWGLDNSHDRHRLAGSALFMRVPGSLMLVLC